ncbi:MAG: aminopeptidase [Clostridia bacterium]|nr:aminopeptidase [Clostridia bacterium]
MKKTVLREYAKLIATVGANVQKGQDVIVMAELDQPEFVEMVVDQCYKAGARKVEVQWTHQPLTKINVRHKSLKTLSTLEEWEVEKLRYRTKVLPCMIYLLSEDPDGLNGINQAKMSKATQAKYKIIKPFRDEMDNKYQWTIAAVPGVKWAKKMFPNLSKHQAVEKLWEAILYTSRADSNPIENWKEHNKDLHDRCQYLNSLGIEKLHYTSSNGTDLTVGMIPEAQFLGGGEESLQGIYFNANIPTEECFISPKKGEAEGIVYSTKPLSYRGEVIENFFIEFKEGKAVKWGAERNEDLLSEMLNMDEGAAYLGECALVPFDSPINNSGLTFYNTLFDENACCHLAMGRGFTNTIREYEKYNLEQFAQLGVNDSMIHEDFMIGSEDLSIEAICADGKKVQIFKDGNWAF